MSVQPYKCIQVCVDSRCLSTSSWPQNGIESWFQDSPTRREATHSRRRIAFDRSALSKCWWSMTMVLSIHIAMPIWSANTPQLVLSLYSSALNICLRQYTIFSIYCSTCANVTVDTHTHTLCWCVGFVFNKHATTCMDSVWDGTQNNKLPLAPQLLWYRMSTVPDYYSIRRCQ